MTTELRVCYKPELADKVIDFLASLPLKDTVELWNAMRVEGIAAQITLPDPVPTKPKRKKQ